MNVENLDPQGGRNIGAFYEGDEQPFMTIEPGNIRDIRFSDERRPKIYLQELATEEAPTFGVDPLPAGETAGMTEAELDEATGNVNDNPGEVETDAASEEAAPAEGETEESKA